MGISVRLLGLCKSSGQEKPPSDQRSSPTAISGPGRLAWRHATPRSWRSSSCAGTRRASSASKPIVRVIGRADGAGLTAAARSLLDVDPDQEVVGIGTSNIAPGFFQGFAVSVSGCREAVVDQSGARTQLAGLVGAGLAAVLLLFLNSFSTDSWPTFLRPPWPLSSLLRLCRSWTWASSGDTPRSAPQRSP